MNVAGLNSFMIMIDPKPQLQVHVQSLKYPNTDDLKAWKPKLLSWKCVSTSPKCNLAPVPVSNFGGVKDNLLMVQMIVL